MKSRHSLLVHSPIRRHRHGLKRLTRCMLNTRQQSTGTRMHKQNRFPLPTRSPRAANPMNICLTTTRQIKIDHVTHSRHIQPASRHVSGYHHIQLTTTQLLNNSFPLRLSHIAMQRCSTMTLTAQILRQRLRRTLQLHKHNHRINRLRLQNSRQCRLAMMIRHHHIPLTNRVCRRCTLHDRHFSRIPLMLLSNRADLSRQSGRKQGRLTTLRRLRQHPLHTLRKTHPQHLIRFVQHQTPQSGQIKGSTSHVVHDSARSPHNDVHPTVQLRKLRLIRRTTVDRQTPKIPHPR